MIVAAVVVVLVLFLITGVVPDGRPPKVYEVRHCMGRQWRDTCPGSSKAEIRKFLGLFVDAFGFSGEYRLGFQLSDRILDVYYATIGNWGVDAMELETLADNLEKAYRVSLRSVWRDDLTLGELFSSIADAPVAAEALVQPRRT